MNGLNVPNLLIEPIYLALGARGGLWVGAIRGRRWIGLLEGRGRWNRRFPGDGPAVFVFGVLGPCAGATTRSVWGRIVVLAADKNTMDRLITP